MREEWSAQFAECLPKLRRFAYGLCGSVVMAEDLAQEAFTRLLATDGEQHEYLERWLFRTVRNLYIDQIRKLNVQERYQESIGALHGSLPVTADRSENLIALEHIRELIAQLPREQREVLLLVGVEGYSYREASEILNLPLGTITSRLARARGKLIDAYAEQLS
ncbi:MAG: RNA polymerase sigma factor [Gammaproteobacteria bacterium]|nr:RNA polymerase sigma factor [Gammaproteobacteria bacterium]